MAKKSKVKETRFSNDTPELRFLLSEYASPFYKSDRLWQNAIQYIAYTMLHPKSVDKKKAAGNRALREKILGAFDPLKCRYFLTNKGLDANNAALREDHEEALPKILRTAVREKFGQNPMLLHLLLQTEGRLVYDNQYDEVLGVGRKGDGQNLLGETIETFRDKVRKDYSLEGADPTVVFTICAEISEAHFTGEE